METNYWSGNKGCAFYPKLKNAKKYGKRITDEEFMNLDYEVLKASKQIVVILITNCDFIAAPILDTKRAFNYWKNAFLQDDRLYRFFIFKESVFKRLQK